MDKEIVLLIEDHEADRKMVTTALEKEGYRVEAATTGEQGLEALGQQRPNLVLLDLMLPGMDGLEVCRQIRNKSDLPIIMISGKDDEVDKVVGLELGADDYITKPYGARELVARVRAMLRRTLMTEKAAAQKRRLSYPGLEVDLPTRTVECQGESVHLTPKEFDLLYHLASHPAASSAAMRSSKKSGAMPRPVATCARWTRTSSACARSSKRAGTCPGRSPPSGASATGST